MLQFFSRASRRGKRILQIGFVTPDSHTGKELKEFISKRDGVELLLIKSASVTSPTQYKDISVFVYDLEAAGEASMKEFDRFMSTRPPEVPVIVLSSVADDALVRWFLRLRVADWVKTPLSPGELIAACGRAISMGTSGRQEVNCITFMGARGGVGATTLALHAAVLRARDAAPVVTTCLIDLDLISGSCADYLDLQANWQIPELVADPSRLDGHMLDTMTVNHASGVAVLSAHLKHGERFTFSEDIVTRTLDLATQKYHALVVDLPRHAESWTEGVILGSSQDIHRHRFHRAGAQVRPPLGDRPETALRQRGDATRHRQQIREVPVCGAAITQRGQGNTARLAGGLYRHLRQAGAGGH